MIYLCSSEAAEHRPNYTINIYNIQAYCILLNILYYNYNKLILLGMISKLNNIQGIKITKAITIGNNMVQQKDINWSKRILGNEALAHINTKIIIQDFTPKVKPYINPSIEGSDNILGLCKLLI